MGVGDAIGSVAKLGSCSFGVGTEEGFGFVVRFEEGEFWVSGCSPCCVLGVDVCCDICEFGSVGCVCIGVVVGI